MKVKNGTSKDYEADGHSIWSCAYVDGRKKYEAGHKEHKSKFWTAGALWYANNLRHESLDAIAYSHHLIIGLNKILDLAMKLEAGIGDSSKIGYEIRSVLEKTPITEK
ncbi:hypothetical protein EBR03_10330 [bacterium]|nr:hypothetical protein [bacterium]